MNILFAASEAYPLIKTGGLADVLYGLPLALQQLGHDVRLVLPAYREVLHQCDQLKIVGWMDLDSPDGRLSVRIFEAKTERFNLPLFLVDIPALFDRPGNPYLNPMGENWPDNGKRFAIFSRAVAELALNHAHLSWCADIVHAHDWQTGLIPAYLSQRPYSPPSVFTIHNLSYAGIFSRLEYDTLQLPWEWWHPDGVEFYGNFSMLKAGIVFANRVTTVSPSYAREVTSSHHGYGFEGLFRAIDHKFSGILNGIDSSVWNPEGDPYLTTRYSLNHHYLAGKRANKEELLHLFNLTVDEERMRSPLFGFIGRMVSQKGIDLIATAIPRILGHHKATFILLGTGEHHYQAELQALANLYPGQVALHFGYSEELAHRIEAGCDAFLMPSRFEPCGLNQLYSLAYGTPPIVHAVGGLADSIVDATLDHLTTKTANGFCFYQPTTDSLLGAIYRAIDIYQNHPAQWRQLIRTGMAHQFDWHHSALHYQALYELIKL
ncbi:glycogen synthase GlgA [Ectothiorhodospiraceae bacterium BW-2]|nr:glycogen synthase GlgA [Ectothiorhodospiraceae bacterium BW-2]